MSMKWGVYEQWEDCLLDGDECERFVAYHVMPCVVIEGEDIRSGDHTLRADCPCGTFTEINEHGCPVVQHHAPDHPGALPDEEWKKKTRTTS